MYSQYMGGLKWKLCYKKSRVLASARMPPLVANPWDVFFSRAGATLHNVTREWAFLKGVTSVNWKMTGWEDKRQKGRSMTPCDVAVSRLNTRPREKGAYTSIKFGKVSVFSRRHEGAKRRIKDQFGRNVFSQQASMPNVFTTDQSPVRTLPAISSSRSKNVASQF